MANDLITVVIPNYNGLKYLAACLDSILSGTLVPDIVVVDNASRDGSRELVEELYPMVTLLKLGVNTGFCHAVNAGLHITRTPYVMLLNNDTRVETDCIEKLLNAIEHRRRVFSVQALMVSMKEPEVVDDAGDLYSALGWGFARAKGKPRSTVQKGRTPLEAKTHFHNETGSIDTTERKEGEKLRRTDETAAAAGAQGRAPAVGRKRQRPVRIFSACAGAALYRMEVFDEIGWFDERHYCYLEDIDIGWRAQIAGYGNRLVPDAVVYHAGSATSGSRYNTFKETLTPGNNAYLQYKNMPLLQYWINAPFRAIGNAVKRRYFAGMGFGEAFENGLRRGEWLIAGARQVRELEKADLPWKKGSLSEEACVAGRPKEEGSDEPTLEDVVPLYLGGKVSFRAAALPRYLSIEGQLIAGCFRRLWN